MARDLTLKADSISAIRHTDTEMSMSLAGGRGADRSHDFRLSSLRDRSPTLQRKAFDVQAGARASPYSSLFDNRSDSVKLRPSGGAGGMSRHMSSN